MANHLDAFTHRPIGEWRLTPPEIHVAENGYVLRTYDIMTDTQRYRVSTDIEGVRAALRLWADLTCDQIRKAAERELEKV